MPMTFCRVLRLFSRNFGVVHHFVSSFRASRNSPTVSPPLSALPLYHRDWSQMAAAEDPSSLWRLPKSLRITQRPVNLYSRISRRPLILSRRLSSRILCHTRSPDEKQTSAGRQPLQLSQRRKKETWECLLHFGYLSNCILPRIKFKLFSREIGF